MTSRDRQEAISLPPTLAFQACKTHKPEAQAKGFETTTKPQAAIGGPCRFPIRTGRNKIQGDAEIMKAITSPAVFFW
jgi:hypothetical protein